MLLSSTAPATASPDPASTSPSFLVILKGLLEVIESHPFLFGIATSIVAFLLLWFGYIVVFKKRKKLREKQAEASVEYYPLLYSLLFKLRKDLLDADDLETDDFSKGNIYVLIYTKSYRRAHYPLYREHSLHNIIKDVSDIKEALKSDKNVHPWKSQKSEWQSQIEVVKDFCDFILNEERRERDNPRIVPGRIPPHIKKAKELKTAMDFILREIEYNG